MTQDPISRKMARLREGHAPRILDLFSGCGGLSLGFRLAGCSPIGGVEVNPNAARTYARNLHRELPIEDQDLFAIPRDIRRTDPLALLREFGHRSPVAAVDIIVGGPPCQAYARVGRAKLRKVKDHPEAFQLDERGSLYEHYLRFVATLKPVAILMENVPDILNYGGRNIAEEISENLEELGYSVAYTLLNAAAYGVPQTRERFFLMAWHSQVSILPPSFPPPTRHVKEMPVGYKGTRAVASRLSAENRAILPGFRRSNRYVDVGALPSSDLQGPVTAFEAIGDLPRIMGHLDGSIRRGPRRFDSGVPYDAEPHSEYARLMRTWPGFIAPPLIMDHVIRASPRDYPIFRAMRPGDEYPQAHALAVRAFEQRISALRLEGTDIQPGSEAFNSIYRSMVPPYDPSKFPNKWRKIDRDEPVRTLMAHLSHDSYSHIHYDDEQARTISVREAARFQSFPDGFAFSGTMNQAFAMIGNAVPPLLAFHLARHLRACIQGAGGEVRRSEAPHHGT